MANMEYQWRKPLTHHAIPEHYGIPMDTASCGLLNFICQSINCNDDEQIVHVHYSSNTLSLTGTYFSHLSYSNWIKLTIEMITSTAGLLTQWNRFSITWIHPPQRCLNVVHFNNVNHLNNLLDYSNTSGHWKHFIPTRLADSKQYYRSVIVCQSR